MNKIAKKKIYFLLIFIATVFLFSGCDSEVKNIQPAASVRKEIQVQKEVSKEKTNNEVDARKKQVKSSVVEVKEESKTEKLLFKIIKQNDSNLEKGQIKLKQAGKEGIKELKYKVTYDNGIEKERKLISENTIVQPTDRIVLVGTKKKPAVVNSGSCGGDYYRNVSGNCIHRPSSSPSGASAKCRDGSYSYSQHRRGTCSGHGGVSQWL